MPRKMAHMPNLSPGNPFKGYLNGLLKSKQLDILISHMHLILSCGFDRDIQDIQE